METSCSYKNYDITLTGTEVGPDLQILISGGEKPHIGAVAVASLTPLAHQPDRMTVSISVIALPGHKEDQMAREAAQRLAKGTGKTVVVSCGIHYPDLTMDEIADVNRCVEDIVTTFLEEYLR